MYSFPNLEPVHCSMSDSNCCFLTCIQIFQDAGQVAWYSHLFQNFPQFVVIHRVKNFAIVNKAEVYDFLEFSCYFDDPADAGNLISDSSAFSKVYLRLHSWCIFFGFEQVYNDIYPSFYYDTEDFLLCSVLSLSIHPPITPGNLWSFYHLQNFAFLYHTS